MLDHRAAGPGRRHRRRALLLRGAALAAPALLLHGGSGARGAQAPGFTLGVASGDPWPDGVVLWTRLAPDPLAPLGGMPPDAAPILGWEVAEDERFARIAARGGTRVDAVGGFAAHVEVTGLRPGRPYWYRFLLGDEASPVGRTRTAPAPDATPARLRLVDAGCQHLEHGFFTAWRHVAEEEELDLVFHYGDFIYEYAGRRPGDPGGFGPAVRTRAGGKCRTLEDFRRRYAQYRADPDLAAAQAAHPFVMSFDDHEAENNWAAAQSEADGRSARQPVAMAEDAFLALRAAAFQAWWENMPVRAAQRPAGPDLLAHRRLRWGRLADLHVLDTRSASTATTSPAATAMSAPARRRRARTRRYWARRRSAGCWTGWPPPVAPRPGRCWRSR
jgi:alkaline phosphatase D